MSYQIVEGSRKNSNLYVSNDFLYIRRRVYKDKTYLRCRTDSCPGTAVISCDLLFIQTDHNHSGEEKEVQKLHINSQLKQRAELDPTPLREIYNEITADVTNTTQFHEIEKSMYMRRRQAQPKVPKDGMEAATAIQAQDTYSLLDGQVFYRSTVSTPENETAIILVSKELDEKIQTSGECHLDATFKTVPRQFYQLLTLMVTIYGILVPAIHVLMTSKSERLYKEVFASIRLLLPRFEPEVFLCDFERGLTNAIEQTWQDSQVFGCLFHFTQALYRKFGKLGGVTTFKGKERVYLWLTHFYVLPHVPADRIPEIVLTLEPSAFFSDDEFLNPNLLNRFYNYFKTFWIERVTPTKFSIFNRPWRTNNDLESYHAQLSRRIKIQHPNFWVFYSHLQRIVRSSLGDTRRILSGNLKQRPQKQACHCNLEVIYQTQLQFRSYLLI